MKTPEISIGWTLFQFQRLQRQLAAAVNRFTKSDGVHQSAIPALSLYRRSVPGARYYGIYQPALSIIAQGAKRVMLADEIHDYDQAHCLVTSVDLPVVTQVVRATPDEPYLGLLLDLNPHRIGDLMTELHMPKPRAAPVGRGMMVSRLSTPLLDAVLRLMQLLATPQDIPILAPLIEREIMYRLLTGEQGTRLRHIAVVDSQTHQVARAIDWIRMNYFRPLRVENLARTVNMSPSSLHHNFKAITAMSPLQYQKQLRLQAARRLMLTEMLDAASAAYKVGYESASQFSREYSRLYGAPPLRDVAQLRMDVQAAHYVEAIVPRGQQQHEY